MPKFFVTQEQVNENKQEIKIKGTDVNHLKNVLRIKIEDKIEVCNLENQQNYYCQVKQIEKECITAKILERIMQTTESNVKVSVFQGLPKAEKMELIIQKAVELGVYDITPVDMKRCIVKLKEKDSDKKIQRWQKISEVAAKQCERNIIPEIHSVISSKDIGDKISGYDVVLVAYEEEKVITLKEELLKLKQNEKDGIKIAIVIGPEGGLENEDVEYWKEKGAKVITLGKRILRTETVALQMLSIIMYELEK